MFHGMEPSMIKKMSSIKISVIEDGYRCGRKSSVETPTDGHSCIVGCDKLLRHS